MLKKLVSNKGEGEGVVIGVILAVLLVIAFFCTIMCTERVPVGYIGCVYSMNGGLQNETLAQGWHVISPTKKVKLFTIGNEQLILTKDSRDGSEEDESFRVATADNASIAISFQMSYRFIPDQVVSTFNKFKGMSGNDIVEQRVKTVLKSTVSEVTTSKTIMDIYSGNRSEINEELTKYLNDKFSKQYGIEVMDASIIDAHPDKQLRQAINNRIEAQQKADQAKAEQKTAKVEAETAKIKAQNDAEIKVLEAQAKADSNKVLAEAEAESNRVLAESITDELIRMKEAEARYKHGWVEVTGASTVVKE